MTDELTPASHDDIRIALAMALTDGRRREKSNAAEVMARVVAERIVDYLDKAGFVVMRKPVAEFGGASIGRGFEKPTAGSE